MRFTGRTPFTECETPSEMLVGTGSDGGRGGRDSRPAYRGGGLMNVLTQLMSDWNIA